MGTTQTEVLVVGAGPSGLAAALILAARGRKVRLIDKNAGPSTESRALGVQAGTLELFERVFGPGLPEEMIRAGTPARGANMHIDDGRDFFVSLDSIPSKYNYILMLAQNETERILGERLAAFGVRVERGAELTGLTQDENGVRATVNGGEILCSYLLGCDGAHSGVRHFIGQDFQGSAYTGQFLLADLHVDWSYKSGEVHTFFSASGAALFFPLNEDGRYRLILAPRSSYTSPTAPALDLKFVREMAAPFLPPGLVLRDPIWLSRFRISHRLVESMREDRVFLCGDAAHIHSPVGAQGMNTGIHDALDLGDRLALVLSGKTGDSTLEAWERERHANASHVVRLTDWAFRAALMPENIWARLARRHVLPRLLVRPGVQRKVMRVMSEVDVARRIAGRMTLPPVGETVRP